MRVLLQRVNSASVAVDSKIVGAVGPGVLLFVGIVAADTLVQVRWMAQKIASLRIFSSLDGRSGFDRSLLDVGGGALVVSQFTLYGETKSGRRPDFYSAARPEIAEPLIESFADELVVQGVHAVAKGVFGAHMTVSLENDGPVTLLVDTPNQM